jgi:hypothetical protein
MAYGLKYTIPFRDIDNLENLVEIYQDSYTGSVTELIASDAPAVHKYEREDNEDLTSSIMSATLSISFYSTDVTDFRSFYSEGDRVFLVIHKFQGNVVFKGYLLNDITGEPFQDPPYPVMLTATDGLAQLKEIALVGPATDTDLGTLIFDQLNTLDLELDFEVCNDLYEALVMDNTKSIFAQSEGANLLVQAETFDALELNAFDFLLEVCKSFGWVLFQRDGRWIIQRAISRNIDTTTIYIHDWDTYEVKATFENDPATSITEWTDINYSDTSFRNVVYGNGIFIATSGPFRSYSYNGIDWTHLTPSGWQCDAIAYGNGTFVGVGYASVGSPGVLTAFAYTSTDGINWTSRTPAANLWWQAITYGNGLFVAVAQTGTGNRVMTSPDGITWTSRSSAMDANFTGIAYGNGIFVAVSQATSGITGGNVMTSTNGITWTQQNLTWLAFSIHFADGKFSTVARYSTNGINWTESNLNLSFRGLTYGNGYWVGVRNTGDYRIAYSTDAISWLNIASPSVNTYRSITFGENIFVAVAESGSNKIMFNTFENYQSEIIGDQLESNTTWIPVNSDQLLQYQRPIKKLTLTQGDLGQSIIANGESFNESSWFLEGPYKVKNWTITPDEDTPIIQIFPNNIPAQSSFDNEQGVSWDIRFMPNGEDTDQPIISKPVFLDFAGLSLDLTIDIDYLTQDSAMSIALKHVDSSDNVLYLGTTIVGSLNLLSWSETYNSFVYYSTKDDDRRTFQLTSFVLPTAGFLSVELKYFGTTGSATVRNVKIIPTFEGKRNPTEVKKVYETNKGYTSVREDDLVFSDVVITNSKNWLLIGGLPAIVFVEKSLADTPDIIRVPSGAVTQVNRLTDTLGSNTLDFTGGVVNGQYQRQYVAASGFTISSTFILVSTLSGIPPVGTQILPIVSTISSTQRNLTVTFDDYDYTGQANVQIQVFLQDANSNSYQVSTFLLQVNANGTITYTQTNISFENQALLGGYAPTLRDTYARNVLTLYNVLSFRFEGSFRRKGLTMGNAYLPASLNYSGYTSVRLQVIGWEYDLATRVVRITFGQVPTAYVYPIN